MSIPGLRNGLEDVGMEVSDEYLVGGVGHSLFETANGTVDSSLEVTFEPSFLLDVAVRFGTIADKIGDMDQHISAVFHYDRHKFLTRWIPEFSFLIFPVAPYYGKKKTHSSIRFSSKAYPKSNISGRAGGMKNREPPKGIEMGVT
jgi:hypothetical protein